MSDSEYEDILYSVENGVARITINRQKSLNALRGITMLELVKSIERAGNDRTVGVIVLTGAGDRAFSSGGDVRWEKEGGLKDRHISVNPRAVHEAMRHCGKPVIAVVKGYAIGMGNHLAYFCDLTIAADNAIFGQNGPRVASPAEGWLVSYSQRVLGVKKAREMWMLCRRYSAQEALEMGLCNVVVPLADIDAEVEKWCAEINGLSPTCLKIVKASFEADIDYLRDPSPNHFQKLIAPDFFETEESKEGQNAFLEKRKPDFMRHRA
ncbi:enoyl-CoA hydratase-related protein [Hoeflea sp.]|uniref:enoyl-CoA hydratase-related protein n=1 Tax=Hoeflea sp. TaxID=1940281 RepID=UPI0019C73C39|nr:enoyl-CoA hydratase-related protein [Hoeflea sp.]MBC7285941.1 enoyl-CoA hydratase/isomerase family protein [Hoeflea sp.]